MNHDPLAAFEQLARRAAVEATLPVDVTAQVMATVRRRRPLVDVEPEYLLAGMASLAAACVALATFGWKMESSLLALVQPFVTGFQ